MTSSTVKVRYDGSNELRMPFIVAPYFKSQDSLIIYPESLKKDEQDFIANISEGINSNQLTGQYICVFEDVVTSSKKIVVTLVIPTNVAEEGSGRYGLNLTLGLLINPVAFARYDSPISNFFELFIKKLNRLFEIDILDGGADDLIQKINNKDPENIEAVRKKFEDIVEHLTLALPSRETWFHKIYHILNNLLSLKQLINFKNQNEIRILYNHSNSISYVSAAMVTIDNYLSQNCLFWSRISSHVDNNDSISKTRRRKTIYLQKLPPEIDIPKYMNEAKLLKSSNGAFIVISRR